MYPRFAGRGLTTESTCRGGVGVIGTYGGEYVDIYMKRRGGGVRESFRTLSELFIIQTIYSPILRQYSNEKKLNQF